MYKLPTSGTNGIKGYYEASSSPSNAEAGKLIT